MISFLQNEDIFKSDKQTLICPVNTVGVMGNGLALAFKNRVPGLFRAYQKACKDGEFRRRGMFLFTAADGTRVLCFPTKKHWSMPSKTHWISEVLKILVATYKEHGITSLAVPPIGCGKGGLDWVTEVRPLIEQHLGQLPISIAVYEQ